MADIDFGQISEALNDKADRDINNLSVPGFDVTKTQVIKQVAGTIQWAEESGGGGGGTITVDSAMSTTSTNPVQNKVISTALAAKQDTLTTAQQNAVNSGVTSAKVTAYDEHVANGDIHVTAAQKTAWSGKQDKLTAGTGITISAANVISSTGLSSVAWGDITGTLSSQTDLASALDDKATTDLDNLTASGKNLGSSLGKPDKSRQQQLTLGASGTFYTAPSNGWYYAGGTANVANAWVSLWIVDSVMRMTDTTPGTSQTPTAYVPVKKDVQVRLTYYGINNIDIYFIPDEGAE